MIAKEVIDRIYNAADIVDVVGQFVELKKKGANYQCCCPFHQEKTPSFIVSPARQSWHCFGSCQEGGDVVKFLMKKEGMTYPEAIKWLGRRYHIEIEEEAESPEQQQQRLKIEAMQAMMARVQEFYREQLYKKENKAALAYAVSRWGKEYVNECGIGFAPDGWDNLLKWAEEKKDNTEFMLELGLLKRKENTYHIYDTFRNRLMIPIRDRFRNVIGFTARDMSGNDDVAKYINSSESALYHKGKTVFGIEEAYREAMRSGMMFLVEGAPDAMKMHSVGISNVVAPLGGAWTKEQLQMIKRVTNSICFINDADAVPQGKNYGPGIAYVLKNGAEAIKLGMFVSVRELPNGEGNSKQDPDTFFTHKSMMKQLKEEDFIIWATSKWFHSDDSSAVKTENVRRVAELCSYIDDDVRMEMILPELCKYQRGKEFWKGCINKSKWERTQKSNTQKTGVDLRQYGFYQQMGAYFGQTEKGGEVQWSNFTMKPLFHIHDEDVPRRLFYLENQKGRKVIVEMTMEDLNSVSKFRQKIEGIGNFIWMASEREMIKLKNYLYDNTETAQIIKQMGWNNKGFYAFGNGIWKEGQFFKTDEFGVVCLGDNDNWYIPSASKIYKDDKKKFERERKFVYNKLCTITTADYFNRFIEVYGNNGKIGLCYYFASLFRDIITNHTRSFPILDLFGPKGSGKTELGAALMAFFVPDNKAPNLKNSTAVALNDDVAFASNALVHLDEYKNDIEPRKIEFLKGLYDGVGRVKMSGADFGSRVMTSVKSGIVMSGQEIPTADIALFHRCVYLTFPRSEFTMEERKRFADLREIQKLGLSFITLEVLNYRKNVEGNYLNYYDQVMNDINEKTGFKKLETRIVENWAKILAAFRCLEHKLPLPFTYNSILPIVCDGICVQNSMSGEGNEMAKFWEIVMYLRDNGDLFNESDYRIQYMTKIKTDVCDRNFGKHRRVLLLNTSRIFILYKRAAMTTSSKMLPDDALKEYLKNSDYYLGKVKSVRFKSIIKGFEENDPNSAPGTVRKVTRVLQAMAFDYEVIAERYGISLDTNEDNNENTII